MTPDKSNQRAWLDLNGYAISGDRPFPDLPGLFIVHGDIEGWGTPAPSNAALTKRAQQDGSYWNYATREGRSIVIPGVFEADSYETALAAREKLSACIPVQPEGLLVVKEGNLLRHAWVKQEGTPIITRNREFAGYVYNWNIHLIAADSRLIGGDGTGFQFKDATPYGQPGSLTVTNSGTAQKMPMQITITDSVKPRVSLPGGNYMAFNLTVPAGSNLVLDFETQSVLMDGVNQRGLMTGRWLRLQPGANTVEFTAESINATGQMTAHWSDADH